jgi:ubiquinone/menaquinone biosynthesis C-methylase UbiE
MVFEPAPCDALPFEAAFFDAVTVCAAFHHFPNITAFAEEANRVLKPGGMLYVAEVYYPAFLRAIDTLLVPEVDVSSSEIRRRVRARMPVTYLVPEAVEAYIRKRQLYD